MADTDESRVEDCDDLGGPSEPERGTSGRGRRRSHPLVIGALLAPVGLNLSTLRPTFGIDSSFRVALTIATQERMQFGEEIVFPFGPLGFLSGPTLISRAQLMLGLFFQYALLTILFGTVICLLGHLGLRTRWAVLGTLAFAAAVGVTDNLVPELAAGTIVVVLVALWRGDAAGLPALTDARVLAVSGFAAGSLVLVKIGPGALAIAAVVWFACSAPPRRRNILVATGGVVAGLVSIWVATGQSPSSMVDFARLARELSAGYQTAQAYGPSSSSTRLAGIVLLLVACGLVYGLIRWWRREGSGVIWPVVAIAASAWFSLKQGLVRWDEFHVATGYLMIGLLVLAVRWNARLRVVPIGVLVLASLVAVVADPSRLLTAWGDRFDSVVVIASPSRQSALAAAARTELQSSYAVPPNVIDALAGGAVHAEPWDVNAVWGYELTWRPLPVFQSYSAYTSMLDELNAAGYASPQGPDGVLLNTATVDGRHDVWESPEARLALTCNFAVVEAQGEWSALRRTPNMCGRSLDLATVSVASGETITIPLPADATSLVVASFDLPSDPFGNVVETIARPPRSVDVVLDDDVHRLVTGTATGRHIVRSPGTVGAVSLAHGPISREALTFVHVRGGSIVVRFTEIPLESA